MKDSRGTDVSIGIAASYFEDHAYPIKKFSNSLF